MNSLLEIMFDSLIFSFTLIKSYFLFFWFFFLKKNLILFYVLGL